MISYDSVKAEKESGKWKLVFLKKNGDITYKYISEISRKHDWPKVRHATLKTGWLIKSTGAEGDFTSRQSQTQTASHFPRTAIVTPLEVHIKQNYKDEVRTSMAIFCTRQAILTRLARIMLLRDECSRGSLRMRRLVSRCLLGRLQ